MKIIAIAISLFTVSFALSAKVIVLELDTTIRNRENQEKKTSTTIEAELGKKFKIPFGHSKDDFMQVIVSEFSNFPDEKDAPKSILFKTQVVKVVDGKETILSSPNVETILGKKASVSQESTDKTEFLEIAFLPTKFNE